MLCEMCGKERARYTVDDYVVRDGVRVLSTSWPMCARCASTWQGLLDRCGATTVPAQTAQQTAQQAEQTAQQAEQTAQQ